MYNILYICRTPIWLKTAFAVLVQEGVLAGPWIQSGSSRAPMSGGSQIHKKTARLQGFGTFLGDFSYFPTGPNVVPKT